jgi:HK97 family phage major capsid protein
MIEKDANDLGDDAEINAMQSIMVDGLNKVSREVIATRGSLETKVADVSKNLDRKVEDLEAKTNKSLESVVERINRLKDYSATLGRAMLDISPADDNMKELIPQSIKNVSASFEEAARSFDKNSPLSNPTNLMLTQAWMCAATRSQLRKFAATSAADAATANKIYAAMQEKHFGANWEAITKAAMQEDTALEGGNLVPTIVEADIVRQIKDSGRLFPLARQVQMNKKTHDMPSESGAVTVNWVAEEGTLTGGDPTINKKTLTALKIAGRATMSIELVEDSNVGLLAYLLEVFTEKMAGELDKQLVLGDGSSPAITGINNATGINVVSSSATAAGRDLTWPLLVNTYVGSGEGTAIENGYWIVSPKGYAKMLGLTDSTGQPVVKFGNTETAPAGTLLGRPILLSARFGGTPSGVTATLDDSTNTNTRIIYGTPSSLLFGTRTGMRWDVTDQANWATYQMDARLIGRFGMVVGVPSNFARLTKVNY